MKVKVMLGLMLAAALIGCGGGGGTNTSPRVRFLNASPDTVSLSFNLDDDTLATGVTYGNLTSAPVTTLAGDKDISTFEDGTSIQLDSVVSTFTTDKDHLVASVGEKNFGTENEKRLQLLNLPIDTTVPNGSKARLVVLHAFNRSTGNPTPALRLKNPGTTPLFSTSVDYASVSTLTVDAGTYDWEVKPTTAEQVFVSQTGVILSAGKIYLVLISGIEAGTGSQVPSLRFIPLN